jgi:hypothetical protein
MSQAPKNLVKSSHEGFWHLMVDYSLHRMPQIQLVSRLPAAIFSLCGQARIAVRRGGLLPA